MMERWLYVFLAGSFLPLVAMAQDTAPKGFFKKDYAIAPGAEGRSNIPVAKDSIRKGPTSAQQMSASNSQRQATSVAKKRGVIISVHVSSADKEHLAKVFDEVFVLNDGKTAFITSVSHIGDYKNVTPEMEGELARRNIRLLAAAEPPYAAHVTVSPAWIIQTKQGTHIVEGIIDIHSFFNEFGEYSSKQVSDKGPTTSVEGF
jgi:protein-tyrosine-phosphatase